MDGEELGVACARPSVKAGLSVDAIAEVGPGPQAGIGLDEQVDFTRGERQSERVQIAERLDAIDRKTKPKLLVREQPIDHDGDCGLRHAAWTAQKRGQRTTSAYRSIFPLVFGREPEPI
jgi:hypothetical protein